ncbi:branched-chain amino acid ABC transporter permease [Sphaerobacter sp.]|uniref:branched-chain amino acid ABC transporter permease n=1 Tax=Sphaerobacter sp. TaxID=2099654 RepID=UPI001D512227|nr:branched-chain amino acid ABC transporter permease [Sphaerobacter sp.]MBX5445785.1 branched-chain amino acid ABC transporter permease [Sphaerobacter sp.]
MAAVTLPVLIDQLVSGLAIGGVYALVALGFALIFGVLRAAQFAHGEVYMVVAFLVLAVLPWFPALGPLQFLLVIVTAAIFGAIAGMLIERGVFRPLADAPHIAPIISTIGLMILLQNLVAYLKGSELHRFALAWPQGNVSVGPASVPVLKLVIFGTALVIPALLQVALTRTQLGRAIRATAIDAETARLMGVNTARTSLVAFAIGSALAGIAGVLVGALYGVVYSTMGVTALVKGYAATIIGGVGNLVGAVAGGLLLGLFEVFVASYVSPRWTDAIVYTLLIVLLALRPQGLVGRAIPEKL